MPDCTWFASLVVGKSADLHEQRPLYFGYDPDCRLRGKVLRGYRGREPERAEKDEQKRHTEDIPGVRVLYSDIDYALHDKRHAELEARLEHLEERSYDTLLLVIAAVSEKMFHGLWFLSVFFITTYIVSHLVARVNH